MASTEQARAAVDEVVHRLDEVDDTTRAKIPERSVALLLHDLGGGYRARLAGGRLVDVAEVDAGDQTPADVRFVMISDQLLELLSGELSFAAAWATGRIRVHARLRELLELRRFL